MDGIISPEMLGQLSIIRAVLDPDAREQITQAVEQILAAAKEHDAKLTASQRQETTNKAMLAEASAKLSEAATMAANAEAKRRELEAFEGRLGEVQAALNAEKTKFEDVRVLVNDDHNARGRAIGEREERLDRREREIGDLMMKNTAEAKRLAELGEKLDRSVAAMKAALAELDADPPVDAG